MDPLAWSALLLFLGLLLVVVEVFVPSGGILGLLSIVLLLAGIGSAFWYHGIETGFVFLAITAVMVPASLGMAFRWWPKTPMGRRLLLSVPNSEEVLPDSPQRRTLRQLVGKFGVAKTVMLPSGAVLIEGQVFDALSDGMPIEEGQRVRVIEVRGNRVLVRPDDSVPAKTDDILSQPIESLGLDGLDEPLA